MGCKPAPDVANIFMKELDSRIIELSAQMFSPDTIKMYRRFLDDIFLIFRGSPNDLHQFLSEVNKLHQSIKFTVQHTTPYNTVLNECDKCDCEQSEHIPFLDTQCSIQGGKIIVDLYRKETDRNMYLLTSSCHPNHVTENIPYSLALRIVRICSRTEARDQRLEELKNLLLSRDYKAAIIDAAIKKAKAIPRAEALKKVERDAGSTRPVFVVNYHPGLPNIPTMVKKHWRAMVTNPQMEKVFPLPPLIAYKRPPNIRDKLIRAKLPPPPPTRPKRTVPGMFRCMRKGGAPCRTCPYVKTTKVIKSTATATTVELTRHHTCQDKNIVYIVECSKCRKQYIGETKHTAEHRIT